MTYHTSYKDKIQQVRREIFEELDGDEMYAALEKLRFAVRDGTFLDTYFGNKEDPTQKIPMGMEYDTHEEREMDRV